jgi:putative transposase
MPRGPRLRMAGLPVHVVQRGHNRSPCFFAEPDYLAYLTHLQELAPRFACAVHAYVLMTNHVHLLVTPDAADGISMLMKHLGQRYVQYINRRYKRSGTLWEGRFRSGIVLDEAHLLASHCYIELNPVRAGMVDDPADYPWSSYRTNALGMHDATVNTHSLYLTLGGDELSRRAAYRGLFPGGTDPKQGAVH